MAQYKFIVNGEFVDFYDGAQLVTTIRNTSHDVDWFYTNDPGISFEINGLKYNTSNANQIEINGVTLTNNQDFDAAIEAILPNLPTGASGGAIEGIVRESDNLTYTADTHTFKIGETDALLINAEEATFIRADETAEAQLQLAANGGSNVSFRISAEEGANEAEIIGDALLNKITYESGSHEFVGAVILPTSDPGVVGALWNNAGTPAISTGP